MLQVIEALNDEEPIASSNTWVTHKFGGTSVGSATSMRSCIDIIKPLLKKSRVAVVVSAMGGKPKVTDLLLDSVHAAAAGRHDESASKLENIREKHQVCVNDILKECPDVAKSIIDNIVRDLKDIADLLKAVSLMKLAHEQILELVSGYGEVWSATIMAAAMRQQGLPFVFLNARDVLVVSEDAALGTKVHWDVSTAKLNAFIAKAEIDFLSTDFGKQCQESSSPIPVPHLMITGYIASTVDGVATTLKRDGSDFSASIFGKMLKASDITIWTDVSGVYSADPRRVPEAQIISEVSYTEAIELAYFGAKVIHPKTMAPAITDSIPIYIRNTFEPEHAGTRIYLPPNKSGSSGGTYRETSVCGFSTVDDIALLNIEGTGMIGVPGIAHRLFGALKAANISVMFIAQASSEHSICFATKEATTDLAKKQIEEAFFYELQQGLISQVRVIRGCSIIAAVGESMSNMPGVSGLFFGALGDASINVLSISQGCDERNISAVVYAHDATRALRAVHSAFWLSSLDLSVGIVGTGRVGSATLQTLIDQAEVLGSRFGISLKIRGVINSKKMLLGDNLIDDLRGKLHTFFPPTTSSSSPSSNTELPISQSPPNSPLSQSSSSSCSRAMRRVHSNVSLSDVQAVMTEDGNGSCAADFEAFFRHITKGSTPHCIIIDASTGKSAASLHPTWLKGGAHVVTANKRAIANSLSLYNEVYTAARHLNRMYMSEVTIGASLPIRTTLNDLICSGDAIYAIVGLMSVSVGTVLTYMCDDNLTFSQAVTKTHEMGLFEDDPFIDLDGSEAAMKLLILARGLGYPMNLSDIDIEPLVSRKNVPDWSNLQSVFASEDATLSQRMALAKGRGNTLRYVQRIQCDPPAELGSQRRSCRATVKLEEVPLSSTYALVKGAVYHFSFHTAKYAQHPLVIQGPLSDSANTAAGIVGDILRIARSMGVKDKGPEALKARSSFDQLGSPLTFDS